MKPTRAETKAETRQRLLEAGLAEFVEHGLDAPSLDAICARAGYTRGAFYVHFKDRDDFHVTVTEWLIGQFLSLIVTTDEGSDDLQQSVMRYASSLTDGSLPLNLFAARRGRCTAGVDRQGHSERRSHGRTRRRVALRARRAR